MLRNIIGVHDGTTRGTGIVISDDETSAAVIDLTADSSDDESPNAGAPPTAPSVPSSPGNSADAAMLLAPRTSSSSIYDAVKNGRKRGHVNYCLPTDADFIEPVYCTVCCNKAPIMGPNGPRGEWRGDRFIYRGCHMNCPCKCHDDAA